jgi:hypothetical protein
MPINTTAEIYPPHEVKEICMFYGHDSDVAACTQSYNGKHHIIYDGNMDCYWHEIDHVLHGDWHPGRKAGCEERAWN